MSARLGTAAARVALDVARRLADPQTVRDLATAAGNTDTYGDKASAAPWEPTSLIEGFPGTALLHAELGHTDPAARTAAHAHLAAACGSLRWSPRQPTGLYGGPAALAFAARAAGHQPSDYRTLLSSLDQAVLSRVVVLLDEPGSPETAPDGHRDKEGRAGRDGGVLRPGTSYLTYDVLSGLTGLGRYLLAHLPEQRAVLNAVLRHLIRIAEPTRVAGAEVPGWWSDRPLGTEHGPDRGDHLLLGMAHGVAGPLALLAHARLAGIFLPGAETATVRMADWLLHWRQYDDLGVCWPVAVNRHEQLTGRLDRPCRAQAGWCHGSTGIARALFLAGRAFDRPAWTEAALQGLDAAIRRALGPRPPHNTGLCHGWAGLLRITQLFQRDYPGGGYQDRLNQLTDAVLRRFSPETPFGFALYGDGEQHLARDRAGFLEGAAGTALALWATTEGDVGTATSWDSALLLD